jgi:hypothetical protein
MTRPAPTRQGHRRLAGGQGPTPRSAGSAPAAPGPGPGCAHVSISRQSPDRQRSLDAASAKLAKAYWSDPIPRNLPLPFFTAPEVRIHLIELAEMTGRSGRTGKTDLN